ncbi:MAG: hypothetical protein ACOY5B_02545 [Spirochaetota bacterium]
MIYDFINFGLNNLDRGLHKSTEDHNAIIEACRRINESLNKISAEQSYENYLDAHGNQVLNAMGIFFSEVCSKWKCPNLWPLMKVLWNLQDSNRITRSLYRDHVLHSAQNVLLGFALLGHKALVANVEIQTPSLFISLAYHDLGYVEQAKTSESSEGAVSPVLETFFRQTLENMATGANLMMESMYVDVLASVLCLDRKMIERTRGLTELKTMATQIWTSGSSYEETHLIRLYEQMRLSGFPLRSYRTWKEKKDKDFPERHNHSLASAMLLLKIASTREHIIRMATTDYTLGDPYHQTDFSSAIYGALRSVFLHDFDLYACPDTRRISETLNDDEIFVISVDEFQTYGRRAVEYDCLSPALAGYAVSANQKLRPLIAKVLESEAGEESKPAYFHTEKEIVKALECKIGSRAGKFLEKERFV